MFIQTEQTPNPATLKFLPGVAVLPGATANFTGAEQAEGKSPLAEKLFRIGGVEGIYFGADFITITKSDEKDWYLLKPSILGAVMEHFTAGDPVMVADAGSDAAARPDEDDDEIVQQIKELLETRVRPAVAQDGGDIVYQGFESGVVYLQMQGACAGCPSSTMTLKSGVENMLRHYIPEVTEVRAVF